MSSSSMGLLTILEIGLAFGPIFILGSCWWAITDGDWLGALVVGVVLTVFGWVAMDIKRSVRCEDWQSLDYLSEDGCKDLYFEDRGYLN